MAVRICHGARLQDVNTLSKKTNVGSVAQCATKITVWTAELNGIKVKPASSTKQNKSIIEMSRN